MREGWKLKTLGQIGKVSMCKRILKKQTSAKGDIPFYKIGTFGKIPNAFISKSVYDEYKKKYSFPNKGDILLSASGTIGRRVVYDGKPAYFQDSNIVWIENDESQVLNDYLYKFYGYCDWNPSKGATISRLYNDDLRRIEIPIPPLSEQQQIVAILDEVFEAIDQARANIEKNMENAKELLDSYKIDLLSKFPESEFVPFHSIVKLTRGHNPPKKDFISEPKENYVRFYQIRDGWSDNYQVYVPKTSKLHMVEEDEILMVAYRHIGRAFRGVSGAFNVALCKITNLNERILNNDYLFELIPSPFIRGELLKISERSLIPSMSVKELAKLKVPLPSVKEQERLVELFEEINFSTQNLIENYQRKLKDIEELKKSILQKAFAGELTNKQPVI